MFQILKTTFQQRISKSRERRLKSRWHSLQRLSLSRQASRWRHLVVCHTCVRGTCSIHFTYSMMLFLSWKLPAADSCVLACAATFILHASLATNSLKNPVQSLTQCYNSFTESYPVYLSELLTVCYPSRKLHSRSDTRTFCIPFTKLRPLDNKLFLSWARQSGTHYCMMFITQHQHLSSKP